MKEISTFRYVEQNELYFSRINGSGLYSYTGEKLDSPSDTCFDTPECNIESHIDSFECPVFENIITGRRFFGKKLKDMASLVIVITFIAQKIRLKKVLSYSGQRTSLDFQTIARANSPRY